MRESIGTVSLLNFIIFFILLVFAFLAGTLSYYKAYRVNNAIVSAIEKYEGFNKMSYEEIEERLASLGYERIEFTCPKTVTHDGATANLIAINNHDGSIYTVSDPTTIDYGYCIYFYKNDTVLKDSSGNKATTDRYDSYEVLTFISYKFPVIQSLLKLRVSSRTARIFYFDE